MSADNHGYDVESTDRVTGRKRFIEVKGRRAGAPTVTISKNEYLTGLNSGEQYALAIVEVEGGTAHPPRYIWRPFIREIDPELASVTYNRHDLLERSEEPS